jgi:hypothetical protein
MNGKRTLPFGLLTIAVVLALALMGVAYALWSETLTISGSVATGEVDVAFQNASDNDNGIDPGYDKDVADCTVAVAPDGNSMTITITNGYPSYTCTVSYEFLNDGSIPVKLQSVTENIPDELTVTQTGPGVGYQLDAGDHVTATIAIHVDQEAAELANYSLSKSFLWVQWNEYHP